MGLAVGDALGFVDGAKVGVVVEAVGDAVGGVNVQPR